MCYGKPHHKKKATTTTTAPNTLGQPVKTEVVKTTVVTTPPPKVDVDMTKILATQLSEQGTVYQPNPEIVPLAQQGDFVPADVFYSVQQVAPISNVGRPEFSNFNAPGINNDFNRGLNSNPYISNATNNVPYSNVINNTNQAMSNLNNGTYANNARNELDLAKNNLNNNAYANNARSEFGVVNNNLNSGTYANNARNELDLAKNNLSNNAYANNARNELDLANNKFNNNGPATNAIKNDFNTGVADARVAKDNLKSKLSDNMNAAKTNIDNRRSVGQKDVVYA